MFAARPQPLFLVAVRVDGRRSPVETFAAFEPMEQAAREWLWNDDVAWVSLNEIGVGPRGGRQPPQQTHIMTRKGETIVITEQSGRLERVRRATRTRSQDTPALG